MAGQQLLQQRGEVARRGRAGERVPVTHEPMRRGAAWPTFFQMRQGPQPDAPPPIGFTARQLVKSYFCNSSCNISLGNISATLMGSVFTQTPGR